jgi:5,10-methylenetetrahydromethanopterin reductase
MMLALAAERTDRIGLGPGVLVPTLRHPMVNASGAAALSALAPGRVAVAFGTGFAGARAMGAKASTWSYLRDYVRAFRGLLRGETVDWTAAGCACCIPPATPRPDRWTCRS